MADRVNIFLTSSLITTQNLVVVSHTVCAQEVPNFRGRWDPRPIRMGGGTANAQKHTTAPRHRTKFRRSGQTAFGRNYGNPQEKFDPLNCVPPFTEGHSPRIDRLPMTSC